MSLSCNMGSWMNYRARTLESGQVVAIYEDHREAVPVIAAALEDGVFSTPPTVLRLDGNEVRESFWRSELAALHKAWRSP